MFWVVATGEGVPLADGAPFLDAPAFWSSYFLGQGVAEEELVLEALGDVPTPDGRAWNLLGKVLNRFELGPDETAY